MSDKVEKKSKKDKKSKKEKKQKDESRNEDVSIKQKVKKSKKNKKDKKKDKIENSNKRSADEAVPKASGSTEKKSIKSDPVPVPAVKEIAASNSGLTDAEIQAYREKETIVVETQFKYSPYTTFAVAKSVFPKDLLESCKKFDKPTPIQAEAWPVCSQGKDMIGIAVTGSGKTMAFAIPSIFRYKDLPTLSKGKNNRGPYVLVLAPTRELACQIQEVYSDISQFKDLNSLCIYGGVDKFSQIKSLSNPTQVIVATPGRLLGLMEAGHISLAKVNTIVLDEADRMLDFGFEPDIRKIMAATPKDRQTVMFSATWPDEVRNLAMAFLKKDFTKVTIGSCDLKANENVTQHVEVVDRFAKDEKIKQLMKKIHNGKNRILVFVLYKKEAPRVEGLLKRCGYKCGSVHGDLNQFERTRAVDQFKSGTQPVLIATDVCARGLDIPNVEYVINYSFPLTVEDYVHRIGRTGRAGKKGTSYTYFTTFDKTLAGPLSDVLKGANQIVPASLEKFGYAPTKAKKHKMYGAHFNDSSAPMAEPTKIKFDDSDSD